jgi:tetratricopeptide (TPR) repeat protein
MGTVTDPEIRSALQEALQAKSDRIRAKLSSIPPNAASIPDLRALFPELPIKESGEDSVEAVPHAEPTGEQLEKIEAILREAHVARIRNNRNEARRLLEEAEKIAPTAPVVLEALADEYSEAKRLREAKDLYARALAADPDNIGLQKKHANAVFQTEAAAAGMTLAMELNRKDAAASARASVWLSLFLPGLGQMVSGHIARGVGFLVLWLGSWIVLYAMGFDNLLAVIGLKQMANPNNLAVIPFGTAVLAHLGAIFDAVVRSTGESAGPAAPKPSRPVPPSNLPFE